jgi:hypothetical protein
VCLARVSDLLDSLTLVECRRIRNEIVEIDFVPEGTPLFKE